MENYNELHKVFINFLYDAHVHFGWSNLKSLREKMCGRKKQAIIRAFQIKKKSENVNREAVDKAFSYFQKVLKDKNFDGRLDEEVPEKNDIKLKLK